MARIKHVVTLVKDGRKCIVDKNSEAHKRRLANGYKPAPADAPAETPATPAKSNTGDAKQAKSATNPAPAEAEQAAPKEVPAEEMPPANPAPDARGREEAKDAAGPSPADMRKFLEDKGVKVTDGLGTKKLKRLYAEHGGK